MVSKMRLQKISDRMQQELSELILFEANDPRIRGISITDIEVDRELAVANIYVSAIEGSERAGDVLEGLNHASGYLRRELAKRIALRTFPQLRFHWDPTPEHADHMEKLFAELRAESNQEQSRDQSEEHDIDD